MNWLENLVVFLAWGAGWLSLLLLPTLLFAKILDFLFLNNMFFVKRFLEALAELFNCRLVNSSKSECFLLYLILSHLHKVQLRLG